MDRTEAFEKLHRVVWEAVEGWQNQVGYTVSMDDTDKLTYQLLDILGLEDEKAGVGDEVVAD